MERTSTSDTDLMMLIDGEWLEEEMISAFLKLNYIVARVRPSSSQQPQSCWKFLGGFGGLVWSFGTKEAKLVHMVEKDVGLFMRVCLLTECSNILC